MLPELRLWIRSQGGAKMRMFKITLILLAIFTLTITSSVHAQRFGYHGHFYGWGYYRGFYPGWYYPGWPRWYYPFFWGAAIGGWPYVGWPYATYAGSPYVGWPYDPPQATQAPPVYSEPQQQQPYWYYCSNPQGYYPYVKSCPGGWIPVAPNASPPHQ